MYISLRKILNVSDIKSINNNPPRRSRGHERMRMYNRNSFYDGRQRYKIVKGTIQKHEVIADGLTSQKAVGAKYKELRAQGIDTKPFMTIAYK